MKSSIDFSKHMSLQINALKFFGLWYYIPYRVDSIRFWISVLIKIIVGTFAFVISTGGQIVYVVCSVLSGNAYIVEICGIVNLVTTELAAELRLLDMLLRRDRLLHLLEQMNRKEFQFSSRPQRDICEKAIRLSRALFIVLLFCSFLVVLIHAVVVPGLKKFEYLPLKMILIFIDVYDPKYYNYVCAYQILYKPCMVVTFGIHQTLPWAAMCFTMSQLDVLIYNFENMKELVKSTRAERNCDRNEAFRLIFRELVLHYSAIIRFTNDIQATFGGQLTAYLFLSTGILGTTALQFFSIEAPLKNIIDVVWILAYLNIFIGQLFLDCYFGNSITMKCEQISKCAFSCPWGEVSNDLKKSVIMFMARTQQPVVITAAKIIPVSLQTFTKVMNWTYKGFAVMNQMK